ncbi:probable jasmonic acid carboxyl methyltransferase 2 [Impatiens glandulifera]|uniref:probable jasmonic acid carboxyl methyltransferase 2 n=1 Tax=Impatiens glandulifera TaxID=253017 RepID=UPI001FB1994B|nr:probable jasmonic acid carboxyl methyltransferase 2 [Impatiens glandulifera]
MNTKSILRMNQGHGENSYANNSSLQMKVMSKALPIVKDIINDMFVNNLSLEMSESFNIADLGCASGPNTLLLVTEVIDTIYNLSNKNLQILVVLNDLYKNDFNSIFTTLPSFNEKLKEKYGFEFSQNCFITGVPSSFYERLFPCKSLHFVHSSNSLHWLSQVPKNLDNKGHICIDKACAPNVFDAYKDQFYNDFYTFLNHRSCEIVPNGRMILTFMGRSFPDLLNDDSCYLYELLAQSLNDMASQGLVKQDDVDSFNIPLYAPYKDEVEAIIVDEKSFHLEKIEISQFNWDPLDDDDNNNKFDQIRSGINVANCIRSVTEPMLVTHFGELISLKDVFKIYANRVANHLKTKRTKVVNLTICLRKI